MNRIGVCLSGGGARGPYQIGIAKALKELQILDQVYAWSGTSIGAVNAAFLATSGVEKSEALWSGISEDEIRTTEGTFVRLMKENVHLAEHGLFKIDSLRGYIVKNLDFAEMRHQRVFVTLAQGGKANESILGLFKSWYRHTFKNESRVVYALLRRYSEEHMVERIIASCSIPVAFPPVTLDENKYYDGGVYDNVPVFPLVHSGCDTIIVAHLVKSNTIDKTKYPGIRFLEIRASSSLGGFLNFSPDRVASLVALGYKDAMEFFRQHPWNG